MGACGGRIAEIVGEKPNPLCGKPLIRQGFSAVYDTIPHESDRTLHVGVYQAA